MPGLFGEPTPEEIRERIGKTAPESSLGLGGPRATPQAAMQQAGFAIGGLIGRALAPETEEEKRAQAMRAVDAATTDFMQQAGLDPVKDYFTVGKKRIELMQQAGLDSEANEAMAGMANTLVQIRNSKTSLRKVVGEMFGIEPNVTLDINSKDPNVRAAAKELKRLQGLRARANVAPPLAGESRGTTEQDLTNTSLTLRGRNFNVDGEEVPVDLITNRLQMTKFVDSQKKALKRELSKTRLKKLPSDDEIEKLVINSLDRYIRRKDSGSLRGLGEAVGVVDPEYEFDWDAATSALSDGTFFKGGSATTKPEENKSPKRVPFAK